MTQADRHDLAVQQAEAAKALKEKEKADAEARVKAAAEAAETKHVRKLELSAMEGVLGRNEDLLAATCEALAMGNAAAAIDSFEEAKVSLSSCTSSAGLGNSCGGNGVTIAGHSSATSSNSSSNSIVGKDTNRREDSLQYLQHLHQDLMELAEFIDRSEEREMLDDLLQRGPEHGHERQKERRKDQDTAWNDLIQATEMASAPSKPSKQQKKLRASERDKKMHDLMTRGPTLASWASLSAVN